MTRKLSAAAARSQFNKIVTCAIENDDRFLVERNGEPAVVILSLKDFVKSFAPPPTWLKKSWISAQKHGLGNLSIKAIDAEIVAARRQRRKRESSPHSGK